MGNGAYNARGPEFLLNDTVAGLQTDLAMAALGSGGFVSVWTDASGLGGDISGTGIRARIFDANGVATGVDLTVNSTVAGAQNQAAVTALRSGGFVVTWTDASGIGPDADKTGVKAQMFDGAGVRIGGEFLVNNTTQQGQATPAITSLDGGGFVVSWVDASGTAPDAKGSGIRAQIYGADGSATGGEFLVNSVTAGSQQFPAMAGLTGGGFVATWVDGSGIGGDASLQGIKAQLFSTTGVRLGGEFLVNGATNGTQDQPAVAALSNGNFVVTWRDLGNGGDSSGSGVKAQIFDASGARIGSERLVNSTTFNTQDQPSVTAVAGGGFAISWRDNSSLASDAAGFGIKAMLFDAAGNPQGAEMQVNGTTALDQEMPAIITLASGALVAGWTDQSRLDGDADGGIKARMLVPTSGAIDGLTISTMVVSETTMQNSAVASLQASGAYNASYSYQIMDDSTGGAFAIDGNALIVQDSLALDYEAQSGATLTIRATDTFGFSFDKVFALSVADAAVEDRYAGGPERLANQTIAGSQQQPAIAALSDGRYAMVWADASGQGGDSSGFGIKAQLMTATGLRISPEFRVNGQTANAQDMPAVAALSSGGFVVTWTDNSAIGGDTSSSGIKAQLYDAAGVAIGTEFLVNDATANAQRAPSVAALGSGGFVVSWTDASLTGGDSSGTSVKAQLYDAAGARVGTEFLVNSATAQAQDMPVVTGLAGGGFVISWHDASLTGGDSSKDAVKAQIYDAAGARIGGEFLVNSETAGNQQQQAITALSGGGFAVAWADNSGRGGDSDYYGIKVQLFDATGARLGGETLTNETKAAGQLAPTIAPLATGGFVVGWADYSGQGIEAGTAGIKGQIFGADGGKVGGEFIVDSQARGSQVDPALAAGADGGFAIGWTDYGGQGGDDLATGIKLKVFAPLATQGGPPPLVATADRVSGVEDQPLLINAATLLANDVDAAGLPLTLLGITGVSGGGVTLDQGNILFTPLPDFSGSALFTYRVTDSAGATAVGRVTVVVNGTPDPPVANADMVGVTEDGGRFAASLLLANDRDPDPGDVLTLQPLPATTAGGTTLTLTNGMIDWTPDARFQAMRAGESMSDGFQYGIVDRSGNSATAWVTIMVQGANDAPTALALSGLRVDENSAGGTVVGMLAASDVDHGDRLSYTLRNDAGGRFLVDPTSGVVSVASGAVLDYETAPTQTIVARATDESGAFTESSFVLQLNNLPEARSYIGDNGANRFVAPTNDLWTINGLGGNDILTGNASADSLYGGAGADTLDGGGGADMLYGGIGNDIYYVDHPGDQVIEAAGEGSDLVYASLDCTMLENVENLTQTGALDINATGNSYANTITGNAGANILRGAGGGDLLVGNEGADTLYGDAGGDFLQGGDGDDLLVGGAGPDQLTGGAGYDRFLFDRLAPASDRDTIKDFTVGEDRLVLARTAFDAFANVPSGPLSAGFFVNGAAAVTPDQHLIYQRASGNLYYDPDGSGAAAMVQIAFLGNKPALTEDSFFLS